MRIVYEIPINQDVTQVISTYSDVEMLDVQTDGVNAVLIARADQSYPLENLTFETRKSNEAVPHETASVYIGTYKQNAGQFYYHVFWY